MTLAVAPGLAGADTKKSVAPSKTPARTTSSKTTSKKSTAASPKPTPTARRSTSRPRTASAPRVGRRTPSVRSRNHYTRVGQQKPSTERILEIQRALRASGYEPGAEGVWDDRTTDALKRFQRDQSLASDGRLSSLTLIALGLGPRRGATPPATRPHLPPTVASASSVPPGQ